MNLFNIRKTFEMKKVKGWPEIYICIDLHGTIIPSGTSSKDKTDNLVFYPYAQEVLRWMSNRKDIMMILWTSTPIERIPKVWQWLNDNEIYFDFLNGNTHALSTPRSDFEKKFYFSIGLDDRFGFDPDTDWLAIKNELIAIGEWDKIS